MENIKFAGMAELSEKEMLKTNGGIFVEVLISLFVVGYMIGKDAAERDRRLQSQR